MAVGRTSSTGLPWLVASSDLTNGSDIIYPTSVAGSGVTLSGGEVSFSAASILSVNGCFNSTYDSYVIVTKLAQSGDSTISLRMRTAGIDASGAEYDTQLTINAATGITNARTTSATSGYFGYASSDHFSTINMHSPALAAITYYFSNVVYGPAMNSVIVAGRHTPTTAYDGFTIIPGSGTITGKLRIYGLRNS